MSKKVMARKVLGFKCVQVTPSLFWELTWLHIGKCYLPYLGIGLLHSWGYLGGIYKIVRF
jgi:hypothetical protein